MLRRNTLRRRRVFYSPLAFGLVPQGVHLGEVRLRRGRAARGELLLDVAEAAGELFVGGAQGGFRIELQVARDVGDDEQQVAELLLDGARGSGLVTRSSAIAVLELGDLLLELGEHRRQRRPVEADLGGFVLQLDGARQGGEGGGHIVENAARLCLPLFSAALARSQKPA